MADTDSQAQAELQRRFSGLERLYGHSTAQALQQAHVAVVGIGGVGSWAAEALARSGVGRITLVDMDHIAESNINRQIHALSPTIGMSKVLAMQERIRLIHPGCTVRTVDDFVSAENWPTVLGAEVDAVIDACDKVAAKAAMADWARRGNHIFVAAGAAGGKRKAQLMDVADLADTTHDPLLAQVRYQLRKHYGAPKNGKKLSVACVFSREAVQAADPTCQIQSDGSLNCHGYGSLVTVTASFGMCAAGWVLEKIALRSANMKIAAEKAL